ncbi:MAG TPA: TonB-dependent receptor [Gammaproteobacteria bacterium]|nr:TonB-dependent receptor [Gammaproteobacteria bacterium]
MQGSCSRQFAAGGPAGWWACLSALATLGAAPATATEPIPEIVVTARKIEENPQQVPMSIQALSGQFLDEADLSRLYELQFNIPGLVVNTIGLFGGGFSLRGISSQGGTGPPVAAHVDGIYLGSSHMALARMFDLERIEVLKGPQGTLYGRNATGGTINFITRKPEDGFGAAVEGSYGSFSTVRAQGHVDVPLQGAAFRLAFIASEGDGYIRNSVDDRRFGEQDYWGLRASLRLEPGDAMRLDLMGQHVRDDGAASELWTPRPDLLVDPRDIRLATITLANPYLVIESDILSANLEYELGFGILRSISGYARSAMRNLDDCAGQANLQGCVRGDGPARYQQWSQEIQLVLGGNDSMHGLVGANYFAADSVSHFHQFLPLVNSAPLNDSRSTSRETAGALFGQATLQIAEQWSLTSGLRLSREKHRETTIGTGIQDSPTLLVGRHESNDLSWRLDLGYAATEDVFLYAGVSTGYKSGGLITRPLRNGQPDHFGPEKLLAYELGGKSQWLDRRLTLNAAVFYYDFDDMQVNTTTFVGDQLVFEVDNAARAELYGVDADGAFELSERIAVSAGIVWLPEREFTRFRDDRTGDTLSGNKLVRAPESSVSTAIIYRRPLRSRAGFSARLEYNYRSSHYFTKENNPLYAQGGFGLLNLLLRLEAADGQRYLFLSGRNLTNERYFNQVFLQSSPGYPDTYEAGAGFRF